MPEKDEIDLLLDSALATYADPGPGSGLEDHVMAALASAQAAKSAAARARRLWLPWAVAIPVAACLIVLLLMGRDGHRPSTWPEIAAHSKPPATAPERPRVVQTERPSGAKAHSKTEALLARLKSCPDTRLRSKPLRPGNACAPAEQMVPAESHEAQAALPKLDVFPTPQPLTPQERGLALVSAQAQPPLREAIVQAQNVDDAPVHIAAIHIPPIAPPGQTQP